MKKLYTLFITLFIGFVGNAQYAAIYYSSPLCTNSGNGIVTMTGMGNYLGGTFSASPSGLFINPVTGEIITSASAPGTYTVTYALAAAPPDYIAISTSYVVTILPTAAPTFTAIAPICYGSSVPTLPSVSNNGIVGTWSPPTISNTATTTYIFTPNYGQCAISSTMSIVISTPMATPNITTESGSNTVYLDANNAVVVPLTLSSGVTGSGYAYEWFELATVIPDANAETYTVSTPYFDDDVRIYNVKVTNVESGCSSSSPAFFVFQSNGTPPPLGGRSQTFAPGATLADVVISGTGLQWYGSATNKSAMSALPLNTLLVDTTTYYASQTVNGEESVERLGVTAHLTLGTGGNELVSLTYSPNPVINSLTIKANSIIDSASVVNILGQVLKTTTHNQDEIVEDMSEFSRGTYFVRVISGSKTEVLKIVKE